MEDSDLENKNPIVTIMFKKDDKDAKMDLFDDKFCQTCNRSFSDKAILLLHIRISHGTETKKYSCTKCNFKFTVILLRFPHDMHPNSEQHWNMCPLSALSNSANLCLAPAKAAAQCFAVFWNMEWWSEYCRATTASCDTIINVDQRIRGHFSKFVKKGLQNELGRLVTRTLIRHFTTWHEQNPEETSKVQQNRAKSNQTGKGSSRSRIRKG